MAFILWKISNASIVYKNNNLLEHLSSYEFLLTDWHNCNSANAACWSSGCPSTRIKKHKWEQWGIKYGVPKHICFHDKYCRSYCPLKCKTTKIIPKHTCQEYKCINCHKWNCSYSANCKYSCPKSKWLFSTKLFKESPIYKKICIPKN